MKTYHRQFTHVEDNLPDDVLIRQIFVVEVNVSCVTKYVTLSSGDIQGKIYQDVP